MRSGFVSIVGRPNTGKSTLINAIVNEKIAIVSDVAGTTRNTIQGVYHGDDFQIVFVDTPGIAKAGDRLAKKLNKESYYTWEYKRLIYENHYSKNVIQLGINNLLKLKKFSNMIVYVI